MAFRFRCLVHRGVLQVLALGLLGGIVTAQHQVIVNPIFDLIDVIDESGQSVAQITAVNQVRYSATDGTSVFWVSDEGSDCVRRFEFGGLDSEVFPVPGTPRALTLGSSGDCAIVVRDGLASTLLFLSPQGGVMDAWPLGLHPELVARGPDASFWVAEFQGTAPGQLRHLSESGQLLGLHPLGSVPTRMLVTRDRSLWVLCAYSQELWRYTEGGDLIGVQTIGPGAKDLAEDRFGQLVLSYPGNGTIEYRASDGTPAWMTGGPAASQFVRDQDRTLWAVDAPNGVFVSESDWFSPGTPGLSLLVGAGVSGAEDAMTFAATGGRLVDSDGDGAANGEEVDLGTRPFDPASSPFGLEVMAPLRPGDQGHLELRSLATPDTLYVTGISHAPAPSSSTPSGFALASGALFDWYLSQAAPSITPSIFGIFDAFGRSSFLLTLPDDPSLAGFSFWLAFRALTEFPLGTGGPASPAWELVILDS